MEQVRVHQFDQFLLARARDTCHALHALAQFLVLLLLRYHGQRGALEHVLEHRTLPGPDHGLGVLELTLPRDVEELYLAGNVRAVQVARFETSIDALLRSDLLGPDTVTILCLAEHPGHVREEPFVLSEPPLTVRYEPVFLGEIYRERVDDFQEDRYVAADQGRAAKIGVVDSDRINIVRVQQFLEQDVLAFEPLADHRGHDVDIFFRHWDEGTGPNPVPRPNVTLIEYRTSAGVSSRATHVLLGLQVLSKEIAVRCVMRRIELRRALPANAKDNSVGVFHPLNVGCSVFTDVRARFFDQFLEPLRLNDFLTTFLAGCAFRFEHFRVDVRYTRLQDRGRELLVRFR